MLSCGRQGCGKEGSVPLSFIEGSRALCPTDSVPSGVGEFPENGGGKAFTAKFTNQQTIETADKCPLSLANQNTHEKH